MAIRVVQDPSFQIRSDLSRIVPLSSSITRGWVQTFMERHNIVVRRQSGKQRLSRAKTEIIERIVAYHLFTL